MPGRGVLRLAAPSSRREAPTRLRTEPVQADFAGALSLVIAFALSKIVRSYSDYERLYQIAT
jgi:hypothetical protein